MILCRFPTLHGKFSTSNCIFSFSSTYGWDHVVQGLVQMGFILMDSYGPKGAFGRVDLVPGIQSGPTHQACQLGAKMLLNTFKVILLKKYPLLSTSSTKEVPSRQD